MTGPHGAAVTVGYVAAGAPHAVVPLLTSDNGVDFSTVAFLLQAALKKKVEEEEQERKDKELEVRLARCGLKPVRKRKKLPKSSSSHSSGVRTRRCGRGCAVVLRGLVLKCSLPYCRSGRARRRQWQWYVLGWFYGFCSSRCVPFFCRQAQDSRHLGRYEPGGQSCSMTVVALVAVMAVACAWLVLLVTLLSRCVPFDCRQARDARLQESDSQVFCHPN